MINRKFHFRISFLTYYVKAIAIAIIFSKSFAAYTMTPTDSALEKGYAKIKVVSELDLSSHTIPQDQLQERLRNFCTKINKEYKRYSWHDSPCGKVDWKADLHTAQGHPLIYSAFGEGSNTTLILGGVHPDELTPIHLSFRLARYLSENPSIYKGKGLRIVIAPLVNPDGFLIKYPTRTNAATVDLNRNFLTVDWYADALQSWSLRKKIFLRFFPGYFPNSEIETVFQNQLLDKYLPSKILSIHAPLGFYDYDGPGDRITKPLKSTEEKARHLVLRVSEKSNNYKIVDFSTFPGSLGKFAGKQRRVPMLTLELQTTDPKLVNSYWNQFLPGFIQSIQFEYKWEPL